MPELPDVEVFRQHAEKHAKNKKISEIRYNDAGRVLKSSKQKISRNLKGQKFTGSARAGKHMFLKTDDDKWLAMHFGMTGFLKHWKKGDDEPEYSKVIFSFDDDHRLSYISKRKLGELEITDNPEAYKKENHIGIDALDCSFKEFKEALKDKQGGIKNVLMDQSKVSGIGNIYSDEILYQEKLHPKHKFEKLDEKQLKSLHKTIQRVMQTAIDNKAQPSDLPDHYLLPHREEGNNCPDCKGKIKKIKINGRGTYVCPKCQKL
ncbi:MAG: hypothetical protein K9G67_09540 [Bacteroidales bacterium]|nr:hypothetical protein [Bacteroidales bacterium]MCF8350537.1 hypothetical protein [Bacteroidales bacterium]MCF8376584.1 hypothetical protein [Bacteroidales bacterium]MCF8401169.1 hypothetical protein [Bacteroidales bacterium]